MASLVSHAVSSHVPLSESRQAENLQWIWIWASRWQRGCWRSTVHITSSPLGFRCAG